MIVSYVPLVFFKKGKKNLTLKFFANGYHRQKIVIWIGNNVV